MTRINKSKDGIIGPKTTFPELVAISDPEPIGEVVITPTAKNKPLKRMNKAELADVALSRQINIEGMITKAEMLAMLEKY